MESDNSDLVTFKFEKEWLTSRCQTATRLNKMSVSKQHDSPILNAFKQHLCSSHNCDIDDNVPVYKPDDGDTDDISILVLSQSLASPINKTVNPGKDIKPSKDKYCISTCSRKQHTKNDKMLYLYAVISMYLCWREK